MIKLLIIYHAGAMQNLCRTLQVRLVGSRVFYFPAAAAYHDADIQLFKPERLYYLYQNKYIDMTLDRDGLPSHVRLGEATTSGFLQGACRPDATFETLGVVLAAFWDQLMDRRGARASNQ